MTPQQMTWRDQAIGLLLALAYTALLCSTANDIAMSRDESFYVVAAERYGGWFEQLWTDPSTAMTRASIDRAWSYNHEHPSLPKSLFALSWLAQKHWQVFDADSLAHRFPACLMSGLILWLIYLWGARVYGRVAGFFAAVAFALLPRVYYHAHLNCFDVPITLMVVWVSYCYWRSLTKPGWALWLGPAFGLALATKHNSWVLPGIFLIHWAWVALQEVGRRWRGEAAQVALFPWWLVAMLTVGPLVFVTSWPWLWHDAFARIGEYVNFHTGHAYYNMAYFDTNYFAPPFPVSFPFVMLAFTVPATTLLLALIGLVARMRTLLPGPLARRLPRQGFWGALADADGPCSDVLFFGCMLAPLIVIALPSTPIFGGTKHWFPAYPFMALYAGVGFDLVRRALLRLLGERTGNATLVRLVSVLLFVVLCVPSWVEAQHGRRFGLSHYTAAAGYTPGAADHGMNRQFWGFTVGNLTDWVRAELPQGGRVWLGDMTPMAWRMLQRDGRVPNTIRPTQRMQCAHLIFVQHEHHFLEVDLQAWIVTGSVRPVKVLTHDGVPIVSVYANPNPNCR